VKTQRLVPITIAALAIVAGVLERDRLIAWFTGRAMGASSSQVVSVQAGALTLGAALEPDPPRQDGAVHLTITDEHGVPVDGAQVAIDYDMPAMGSMAEMRGALRVTPEGGGRYRGDFALPMGGTWTLQARVQQGAHTAAADFRFTVGQPGVTGQAVASGTAAAPGTVTIDPARQRVVGIETAPVVKAPMTLAIRAVGRVTYDETKLTDVTVRQKGWVQHLDVAATGARVAKGQRLFTLYSPDLYAAQQEYLLALASPGAGLAEAAAKKLALYGMTPAQIADLAKRGAPLDALPILAPASGTVIEKDVVEGAAVEAGARLFRLAALDDVWIEADLFEGDLAHVATGQHATITLSYLPGRTLDGTVAFVYPYLDPQTRTGRVRIALPNRDGALKPEMYANVALDVPLGPRVQVPISAVVVTGPRRLVFVDAGAGGFRPQEVTLGARTDTSVEIVSGVAEGDRVVVAGDFLVAAESRLRSAGAVP
jgi:Cu(I)/Ag(I) efflux system membrane fusion protein